ncbi:hypothetical protein [Fulvivirga kasyanovii]
MTTTTTTKSAKAIDKKQELIDRLFEKNKSQRKSPNCLTCYGGN